MAQLTEKARAGLRSSAFALPGRRYPVHDASHARFAKYVASVQHAKGNLSSAQLRAVFAKANARLRGLR